VNLLGGEDLDITAVAIRVTLDVGSGVQRQAPYLPCAREDAVEDVEGSFLVRGVIRLPR
jgi:hypothetical protein